MIPVWGSRGIEITITNNKKQFRILVSAAAAYSLALLPSWLVPRLIGELVNSYGMTEASAGLIAAAEMMVLSLTSLLCTQFLAHASFRMIMLYGLILVGAGNFTSIFTDSYPCLIAIRMVCGLGEGILLMAASAALADFEDSDSAYGKIVTSSIITAMAFYALAPVISGIISPPVTFSMIIIGLFVLMPFVLVMPKNTDISLSGQSEKKVEDYKMSLDTILIVSGVLAAGSILGAAWAFYFVLGERVGFLPAQLDRILAYNILYALFGAGLTSIIGHKFGRFRPLLLGLILMAVATMSLGLSSNAAVYLICTGLNLFGLYLVTPYFLGYASLVDHSGRVAAMASGAIMLAAAIGPYLGGFIFQSLGVEYLAWAALLFISISVSLFIVVEYRLNKQNPPRTAME